tara:strand:- start:1118 stop:1507 length:390 start_codon:yes stop_codon:yes gene_type:complete
MIRKGNMSAIETVQQAYAAFGEGDMEKLASMMSDNYVAIVPDSMPNGGTFNGANDFIQNCLGKISSLWSDFNIEPIQMYESGNTVFLHAKITAGGRTSETMHMSVVENGKFSKFQAFDDSAALNATANM